MMLWSSSTFLERPPIGKLNVGSLGREYVTLPEVPSVGASTQVSCSDTVRMLFH